MRLGEEKYVSLTTFTKDGRAKSTPVWIVEMSDESVGFSTEASSWKVRRIRHTPAVRLQPCDMRGSVRPGTVPVDGVAEVRTGEGYDEVARRIAQKYRLTTRALDLWGGLRGLVGRSGPPRCAVVITLGV